MSFEIGKMTRLPLGYVGESNTRTIRIDVSAWLKVLVGAVIVVEVLRPDKYPYFPATTLENGVLTWTVQAEEVSVHGKGWAQIEAINPATGDSYKSRVVQTEVYRSIEEFTGAEAGEPAKNWVQEVLIARDEAVEAAKRAEEAAANSGGGGGTSTDVVVPSYWENHLKERATDIRVAMSAAGWNKSAFLFYSDAHWTYNNGSSPALLKWLYKHTPINKVIFGGDIINTEETVASTMDYLWEWRAAIRGLEHHSVPGNHDDGNDPDNRWADSDVYTFLLAAEETPYVMRGDALYYYIDEPAEKTRYIYLDTATKDGNIINDPAEEAWLKDTLLSTPDGWHIIGIGHIWRIYHGSPPTDNGWGMGAKLCLDMFDAYNAREGDYGNCTGRVEFCIGGHTHWDADHTSDDGIPVILVETDSKHVRSGLTCKVGTITENSVNAIVADYTNGIVNVIRIGRGNSRIVNLDGSGSEEDPDEPVIPDEPDEPEDTTWMDTSITRVLQTSDDTVAIEWADNVSGVTYVVYDGNTEVARVTNHTQTVLFGVTAGEHAYKVRPQKSDSEVGKYSASVTLTTVADVGFTNMLRVATAEDGSLFNGGLGYKENTRINTSAEEVYVSNWDLSGYFNAKAGDVVRLYNMDFYDVDNTGGEWKRDYLSGYNADYSFIANVTGTNMLAKPDTWSLVQDDAGDIVQFKMVSTWNSTSANNFVAKLRITGRNIDAFSIITVNEEIDV